MSTCTVVQNTVEGKVNKAVSKPPDDMYNYFLSYLECTSIFENYYSEDTC